jgi:uncharacterized protein YjbI with pentapeptide repeats
VLGPRADCSGVVHRWTVEHHGNLRKAKFTKADLRGADLRGADLRGADFRGARLRYADFRYARLAGAHFGPAAVAAGRRAQNGIFAPDAPCAPFCKGADLAGANLMGSLLGNSNFTYAVLTGANLTAAKLPNSNFQYANLTGATFIGMEGSIVNTKLSQVNFTRADLSMTVFDGQDLTGANLTGARLGGGPEMASFNNVNLTNANLTGTTLYDPFSGYGRVGFPGGFTGIIWSNTTCPDGSVVNSYCSD